MVDGRDKKERKLFFYHKFEYLKYKKLQDIKSVVLFRLLNKRNVYMRFS